MNRAGLQALMDATWPALTLHADGPWHLRQGAGGGSRVCAATAQDEGARQDIARAEAGMRALGQSPLFMIRAGEAALDAALAALGYQVRDPVVIYAAPSARLTDPPPDPLRAFAIWPPLEITRRIWDAGGIGAARQAIMARAAGPKTTLLGRTGLRCSGAAFVACHAGQAMLHALEVVPSERKRGSGEQIMRMAAHWALGQAATRLLLAVTAENLAARALYTKLGMEPVAQYHYRQK